MATEQRAASRRRGRVAARAGTVRRYNRATRWFHAAVYLAVLVLLVTGWWLLVGREGDPSPLARLTRLPDTTLHTDVGWALAGVAAVGLLLGARAARTFVAESLRFRHRDAAWFARWPAALWTGRFAYHDGHFDPGQRLLNIAVTLGLLAVVASGVGMALLHGGPAFILLVRVHRWSTYLLTPLLAGHILIAAGVLPGYRGAWRAMHLGGRLDPAVARRLWPGWHARRAGTSEPDGEDVSHPLS